MPMDFSIYQFFVLHVQINCMHTNEPIADKYQTSNYDIFLFTRCNINIVIDIPKNIKADPKSF